MTEETAPSFPAYDPPAPANPAGIPLAPHPSYHKPLYKLMGKMLNPKLKALKGPVKPARHHRAPKKKTTVRYY